jgi:hypothetical protein
VECRSTATILYVGNSVYIIIFAYCIDTCVKYINQGAIICSCTIYYNEIISLSYLLFNNIVACLVKDFAWSS